MPTAPANVPNRRLLRQLGPTGILAAVGTALPWAGTLFLVANHSWLVPWIRNQGTRGMFIFMALYLILGGFALLPTFAFAVIAGMVYGIWGTALAVTAFTASAVVGYYFAKLIVGDEAMSAVAEHPRWSAIHRALVGRGFWRTFGVVTLVRLSPYTPFSLINYLMASARVALGPYLLGTIIGMTPRTLAVVMLSTSIQSFDKAKSDWRVHTAGVVVSVLMLGVITWISQRAVKRMSKEGVKPGEGELKTVGV